jgi:hypothetical protein
MSAARAAAAAAAAADEDSDSEEEEQSWEAKLADALARVGTSEESSSSSVAPPTFAVCAVMDDVPASAPAVTVEGLGLLALPLCAQQTAALRAVAEPAAPFGQGADDDDTAVRQVPAARLSVAPASWAPALARTVARAAAAMGIEDAAAIGVSARLEKLVLHEPSSGGGDRYFAPAHKKASAGGVFGTLLIQLPCVGGHVGGELLVQHEGRRVRVDFAKDSTQGDVLPFAAFFAGCAHELAPLTAGVRLALLYSLVRAPPGAPPAPIDGAAAAEDAALAAAAASWAAAGKSARPRVALLLEHAYTPDSLAFSALRGRDARVARALLRCPRLDVRLALVAKTRTGAPAADGGLCTHYAHHAKRTRYANAFSSDEEVDDEEEDEATEDLDCDDAEMGDVYDEALSTVAWAAPAGREALSLDDVAKEDLLCDEWLFDSEEEEPDERAMHGGTKALTFTWYAAVAVVWLAARTRAVATLARLDGAVARLEAAPDAPLADAAALLGDVRAAVTKAPSKLTPPLAARLLALLPRVSRAGVAARKAGVAVLDAMPRRVRLDDATGAAVGTFVGANAAHGAINAALRRLLTRAAATDVRAAVALAAALGATPAAQAAAHAALEALVDDAAAFARVPPAALPELLQALLSAERCVAAPVQARALGLRVIAALHACHGVPSAAVAASLAAHACRIACGETHDALAALVAARAATQLPTCAALAHAATSPYLRSRALSALASLTRDDAAFAVLREPDVTALCTLLLSQPPGWDNHHAAQLLAVLAASRHGIASAAVAAAMVNFACRAASEEVHAAVAALVRAHARRQLPAAIALMRAAAPPRAPALFTATLAALMEGISGDVAAFAAMPDDVVLQLAELVFSPEASSRGAGEALAAATLAMPAGGAAETLCRTLLASPHVRAAAARRDDAGAARLLAARVAQLETRAARGPPAHSWAQPCASFPADAGVELFLRGGDARRTFHGRFRSIGAARDFAAKHFGTAPVARSYDATAVAGGAGRGAHVEVTKTDAAHERRMCAHAAALAELSELRALLLPPAAQQDAGGTQGA